MAEIQTKLTTLFFVVSLACISFSEERPKGIQSFGSEFRLSTDELQKIHDDLEKAFDEGSFEKAAAFGENALAIVRSAQNQNPKDLANLLTSLGEIRSQQGNFKDAEKLLIEALETGEASLGRTNPIVATVLNSLGLVSEAKGDFSQALSLRRAALASAEGSSGTNSPLAAAILHNIARIYALQGKYSNALESLSEKACFQK